MTRTLLIAGLLVVALAACLEHDVVGSCPGAYPFPSGEFCFAQAPDGFMAPDGFVFPDLSGDMVVPLPCTSSAACADATPICSAQLCRPCQGPADDAECMLHNATTPRCIATGRCGQCRTSADCGNPMPACDGASNTCRACMANSECTTGVCILPGGTCATAMDVATVDNGNVNCNNATGVPVFCDIAPAIATNKKYVVVAGSVTPYNAVTVSATAGGATVTLIGPGRNAAHTAKITQANQTPVNVQASVAGSANVTVDGFELVGSLAGTKTSGASCAVSLVGGVASLTIKNSSIHDSGGLGVTSSGCTLVLDGNLIGPTNQAGGVSAVTALGTIPTTYTITNNIIFNNGNLGAAVQIDNQSSGVFDFDTVANNSATASDGGIDCGSGATKSIRYSIVVMNSGTSQLGPKCVTTNVASSGPVDFVDGTKDYRLQANDANNAACCVDKIPSTPALTSPNADHDVLATLRPKGMGYDLGAHEVQ